MEISENQNIQIHRTMNQICNICKKKYTDPVTCTSCKSLFCNNCCKKGRCCKGGFFTGRMMLFS